MRTIDRIASLLSDYTGRKLATVAVVADPRFDGVYAARADGMEFIVREPLANPAVDVEEVSFVFWPPC